MQDIEDLFSERRAASATPATPATQDKEVKEHRRVEDIEDAGELLLVMQRHQKHNGVTKECLNAALRLCRSRDGHYLSELLQADAIPRLLVVAQLHPHDPQLQTLVACFLSMLLAHSFVSAAPIATRTRPARKPEYEVAQSDSSACASSNSSGDDQHTEAEAAEVETKRRELLLLNIVKTELGLHTAHRQHAGFCAYAASVVGWAVGLLLADEAPVWRPNNDDDNNDNNEGYKALINEVLSFAMEVAKAHEQDAFCISNVLQVIVRLARIERGHGLCDEQLEDVRDLLLNIFESIGDEHDLDVVEAIFSILQERRTTKGESTAMELQASSIKVT